jgi:hypothetical protein
VLVDVPAQTLEVPLKAVLDASVTTAIKSSHVTTEAPKTLSEMLAAEQVPMSQDTSDNPIVQRNIELVQQAVAMLRAEEAAALLRTC